MNLSCRTASRMDDSLIKKKAHSQFDSTCFAQNGKTQLNQ